MNAHRIATVLVVFALAAPDTFAQQVTTIAPGTRVRVGMSTSTGVRGWQVTSVEHLTGKVTALQDDTLYLDTGGSRPALLALSRVSTVEISQGTKSSFGRGALIGGLVGGVLGGLASAGACSSELYGQEVQCSGGEVVGAIAVAGVGGAAVGAVIGALIRSERWQEVPLRGLRVQPSPVTSDGVAISASLRW